MQNSVGNTEEQDQNKFLTNNYRVLVRGRPLTKKQIDSAEPNKREKIVRKHQNTLYLYEPELSVSVPLKYEFDRVFLENEKNIEIFKSIQQSLDNFLNGFNTSVMAYGMTGAGKSYTMFGSHYSQEYKEQGVISLALKEIFSKISKEQTLNMSFMELYNQQLRDLLVQKSQNLAILEDNIKGISIPDLTQYSISCYDDFVKLLKQGSTRRSMASTSSNILSSRSHCIIQLTYVKKRQKDIIYSKIYFVDLAGSERASDNRGIRLQEGGNINKSLLALANCINSLGENKNGFIPYRDSKLTRLLKDSLGGNSKTILIVCISPSFIVYQQTLNTLKYASRALRIRKQVTQNIKSLKTQQQSEIQKLKGQIFRLKNILQEKQNSTKTSFNFSPKLQRKENKSNHRLIRDVSPNIMSSKNLLLKEKKMEKQIEHLKKVIVSKDLQLIEKDQVIRQMENQMNIMKKQSNRSPLKKCSQNIQLRANTKQQFSPIIVKEKSLNKMGSRQHEIMSLQSIRQKTRWFKMKLSQLYSQYQCLQKKDRLPRSLVDEINNLIKQHKRGNIMLNEYYTNVLFQFRNLIQLTEG